jgi:D-3-phosphoglycerate dehydrogenase / 2-oxoglutarate reductase
MGALAKQFFYLDGQTRKGNFKSRFEYKPVGLAGKRVGLIGLGRIGRIVAEMCIHGFGMEVWAYDPYVNLQSPGSSSIKISESMDEVIRTADFLSLHVPVTDRTKGLIGKRELELMKPTAFIINTSRGEVIQEAALVDALKRDVIAGAGLDVFEREPPDAGHSLFQIPKVILTPHSAALTKDSVAKLAEGAAENALQVLEGKPPSFSPNWDTVKPRKG